VDWITAAFTAFVLIAPVELPDKTFVATLVLATRYPPLPVWLGVFAAFIVQCVVAVAAGRLIAFLPERPIQLVAAGLFAIGAVILFRGARRADQEEAAAEEEFAQRIRDTRRGWRAATASFAVLFAAEWGDLSQLFTAGLVAKGEPPSAVFVGSLAALAVVSAAAVLLGRVFLRRVRLSVVRYVAAAICAALAVITLLGTV